MANSDSVPASLLVLVDTSLDTHLATAVSPDDTAASLKCKLAAQHLLSFPALGPIRIEALLILREGVAFRLSDSMLLAALYDGTKGACFLQALAACEVQVVPNADQECDILSKQITKAKKRKSKLVESIDIENGGGEDNFDEKRMRKKAKVLASDATKEVVSEENLKHDSESPKIPDVTCRSSHEGSNIKKEGEGVPCHKCKTGCKSCYSEGTIIERKKELEGSIGPSNVLVHKELVPLDKKKLLVLDINGLLADINSDYKYEKFADFKIGPKIVFKRPFCVDFLKFCFANFEVGVWSSRKQHNLKIAVNRLFGKMEKKLLFCWDQSKCTATNLTIDNKPLFLKKLNKLWEKVEPDLPWKNGRFTPSNTLLVDDSPYKALHNPPYTAIFPISYSFKDKEDNSLAKGGDLRLYLENIAAAENVQDFVKENPFIKGQPAITESHPQWNYCRSILGSL